VVDQVAELHWFCRHTFISPRAYRHGSSYGNYYQMESMKAAFTRAWLVLTNAAMMLGWLRVLLLLVREYETLCRHQDPTPVTVCEDQLVPVLQTALAISFVELLNAIAGVTRSKPQQVLLFAVIRMGVELLVAPLLDSCSAWQHLFTVACWSLGDTLRFSCFFLDNVVPGGSWAKSVRYTVGPILFPLGTVGEMLMVISAANKQTGVAKPAMYAAASLWPVGFYSLFTQLMRQRRKFFRGSNDDPKKIK
jgi:Protein tyrosine phosphatase-like protein, PTPLA